MRSVLLLVNDSAGGGAAPAAAAAAAAVLKNDGRAVVALATRSAGEACEQILRYRGTCDVVGAVGGDGTIRGILPALMETRLPLAAIPAGTANVVAREFGIPRRPADAARVLLKAAPVPMDAGRANDSWFLAMLGAGVDAAIVKQVGGARCKLPRYWTAGLRTLVRPPRFELRLVCDGAEERDPVRSAVLCNTRNYGGWFTLAPEARTDDGVLDWVAIRRLDRRALLRLTSRAFFGGKPPRSLAASGTGRTFLIDSTSPEHPAPVQADGDYLGTTPVTVSLVPGAFWILAPPSVRSPVNPRP